jgi:hypothetical protein
MPTIDDTVAAIGQLGAHPLPSRRGQIRRLVVLAGAKSSSLRPVAESIDDASDLIAVQSANPANSSIAAMNELDHERS